MPEESEQASNQSARERILEAAVREFADLGFEGVRMEHVAARAQCNKALPYRYFKDKKGLFDAALKRVFERRSALLGDVPETLGDALVWWYRLTSDDPDFMRLIQREALSIEPAKVLMKKERKAYYASQIAMLETLLPDAAFLKDTESRHAFLALLALTVFPSTFPQITHLATGQKAESKAFGKGWESMLRALAKALGGSEA